MASRIRVGAAVLLWLLLFSVALPDVASAAQAKLVVEAAVAATGEVLQRHEEFIPVSDDGAFSVVQLTHGNDTWQFYEGSIAGRINEPSLTSVYGLQNVEDFPVAFQVTFELPVDRSLAVTRVGARTRGIFGEDATLSNFGSLPFFEGQLDGLPAVQLHSGPFSFASMPGEFTPIPETSIGLPGPALVSGPLSESIGVRNSFVLTGRGSMSVVNDIMVRSVPEPCTQLLLALGVLAAASSTRSCRAGRWQQVCPIPAAD